LAPTSYAANADILYLNTAPMSNCKLSVVDSKIIMTY